MGYTTLNKDEKEEEKKVILFTPTFLPFGQEVSLAQRTRSIPIEISPVLRNLINNISKVVSKISRPAKGRLLYYSIFGGNFG